jgi:hypothetical protein
MYEKEGIGAGKEKWRRAIRERRQTEGSVERKGRRSSVKI